MDYRILGPLEVLSGAQALNLPAGKPRSLLAVLLLHRNAVVSVDTLVDQLWVESPPSSARQMVKGYVADLRRALSPVGADVFIVTRARGYALEVGPGEIDAERFRELVDAGGAALASQRFHDAATHLREALALWRGPALAEFVYERFAEEAIRELEDLHLLALELRIDSELELGRHAQLVGELTVLVRAHPLRERLCELLMLALYRSGRAAEALEAYESTRSSLDELGLEPGPALRRMQHAVLRHDDEIVPAETNPPDATPELGHVAAVLEERRKVVTVLLCDSALSGPPDLDPEALRSAQGRVEVLAARVLEKYGGSVEKRSGDEIAAIFGMPIVHEDDPLRAVRAAVELRSELRALNEQLRRESRLAIEPQIGIDTGEVVAGASEPMVVTGAPLNRARRLARGASPNEILLGEATLEFVRGAVEVAPAAGVRSDSRAYGLVVLTPGAAADVRRFDAPLVGRERELAHIRESFTRCVGSSSSSLFTVLGVAGIGKSRLVAELRLELAGEARVLVAGCHPYGEGITFSPLREMLGQALGHPFAPGLAELLAGRPDREWIETAVARLVGLEGGTQGTIEESFFATRRVFERLAAERPLVLVFEDVHWAEPALLDLIAHIADLARGTSIFVLCLARPELHEHRPGWAGGAANATTMLLERLSPKESARLADWLLRDAPADEVSRAHALELAEGNPLFLEQLCAYADQTGWSYGGVLPPTVAALLGARVDMLPNAERALIERAAIVGTQFDAAAIEQIAPEELRALIPAGLDSLVRKELVRARVGDHGLETYQFRHALIRDAAYRAISKERRAELHALFADWLAATQGDEQLADELVGYHLEQAYRYRSELLRLDDETAAIGRNASARLESAAHNARGRSDIAAAVDLFARAIVPVADGDSRRARLTADLAATLSEGGRLDEAERELDEAKRLAATVKDEDVDAGVLVLRELLLSLRGVGDAAAGAAVVEHVLPIFERHEDRRGLCAAWRLRAWLEWNACRATPAATAWEQAATHARAAGDDHTHADVMTWIATAQWLGPTPVDEALRRCKEIHTELRANIEAEALVLRADAGLRAFGADFEGARKLLDESNTIFAELGLSLNAAISQVEPIVHLIAGDPHLAEVGLRSGREALLEMGEKAFLPTTAARLARALLEQGQVAEAEQFADEAFELAAGDDIVTHILALGARARIFAARGSTDDGLGLAREAVRLAGTTDFVNHHADALLDLANVCDAAGLPSEATDAVSEALVRFEAKGNIASAGRARARLEDYGVH
jgi:predicted ATPase/DNA-binding SARP family transcriptional activator